MWLPRRPRIMYVLLGAAAALTILLIGSFPAGCTASQNDSKHASRLAATFMLTQSDQALIRHGRGAEEEVTLPAGLSGREAGLAVAVDAQRIALMVDGSLVVIPKAGQPRSVEVGVDCGSPVSGGDRIAVLCDSAAQDRTATVRVYTTDLAAITTLNVHRRQERDSTTGNNLGDDSLFSLLAAGPTHFWMQYADQTGFARGGSRLIAKYDWDGRLTASTRLDGGVYDNGQLSSDGRYLAMFAGGSSGACYTERNLRVVDLDHMSSVDTAPDVPDAAIAMASDAGSVYFSGSALRWRGQVLMAEGTTASYQSQDGNCAADIPRWQRTLDIASNHLVDEQLSAPPSSRSFIGPSCGDTVDRSDQGLVFGDQRVLYEPPLPDDCEDE